MVINCKRLIPVLGRPVIPKIDRETTVGVTAAKGVSARTELAGLLPGLAGIPVVMIRDLINETVTVRRDVLAIHALVVSPRDAVPKVPDDCVNEKKLAELIPI